MIYCCIRTDSQNQCVWRWMRFNLRSSSPDSYQSILQCIFGILRVSKYSPYRRKHPFPDWCDKLCQI